MIKILLNIKRCIAIQNKYTHVYVHVLNHMQMRREYETEITATITSVARNPITPL